MRNLMKRFFVVLGAADPKMDRIEQIALSIGCTVVHLKTRLGKRVKGLEAYAPNLCEEVYVDESYHTVICVECSPWVRLPLAHVTSRVTVDQHREGDPEVSPENYMEASSLGQFLALFNRAPEPEDFLIAAADHCPVAAMNGECPGVDPVVFKCFMAAQERNANKE